MAEPSSALHSTETRPITAAVVTSFVSLALLICGGLLESLTLIAISSVGFLGSVIWLWRSDPTVVFGIHLPMATAISLVSGGLYLDSALLWTAGLVLQAAHAVWRFGR